MLWRLLLTCAGALCVASGSDSVDSQTLALLARQALEGKKIRVTFGVTENPYIYKDNDAWAGVLPDFLELLRREVGFVWEEVDVSNESIQAVGFNRNTACARDVSLNLTDLCVGNSWVTTQRLGYAKMLPALWQESLEMVAQTMEDTRFISKVLEAFKPFDGYLWLAIGFVIGLYAVLAWFAEHRYNNRDFPDKSWLSSSLTSLYHGLFGFVWSEPPSRPVTAEGRVLIVGFGFFTLIMLSSYTASLANVLISDNSSAEFQSVQEVLDAGGGVCMWFSVRERAAKLLPELRELAVSMESHEAGLELMDQGVCKVVLMDALFHAQAQSGSEAHCGKVLRGGPILDINCAWPAADWLVGPMALFITKLVDRGKLDELRQKHSPRVGCEVDQNEQAVGLDIDKVSGVFFIMGAFLVTAALVHFCKKGVKKGKQSASVVLSPRSTVLRGTVVTSASASSAAKEVDAAGDARRACARISGRSDSSVPSVDPEDPGHALVLAYREEKRLREVPFEKALLVIGDAHAKADQELLAAMQEVKTHQTQRAVVVDLEVAPDPEAVAAKLHESKVKRDPHKHIALNRR